MSTINPKAYDEVIDFIAAGTTPRSIADFQPSETTKERVADLLNREKTGELSEEERAELDQYMQLEHLMRLAKVRARQIQEDLHDLAVIAERRDEPSISLEELKRRLSL